jgi:hypothetical protein
MVVAEGFVIAYSTAEQQYRVISVIILQVGSMFCQIPVLEWDADRTGKRLCMLNGGRTLLNKR